MEKCYAFQTIIGPFSIVNQQGRHHAVYAGISILSCIQAGEVAAVLGYGYKFSILGAEFGEIDTSNLGIPTDLSDWTRCYYTPEGGMGNFKDKSDLDSKKICEN